MRKTSHAKAAKGAKKTLKNAAALCAFGALREEIFFERRH